MAVKTIFIEEIKVKGPRVRYDAPEGLEIIEARPTADPYKVLVFMTEEAHVFNSASVRPVPLKLTATEMQEMEEAERKLVAVTGGGDG